MNAGMTNAIHWDLVLIRHGTTTANQRREYCGSTDLPLSEEGRENLRKIRESGLYKRWSRDENDREDVLWVTSGMRRTNETLQILFRGDNCPSAGIRRKEMWGSSKKIMELPALREMDFGRFEGLTYEQLKEDPGYQAWISGDNERNICPGGESGELMRARVLCAFEEQICGHFHEIRDREGRSEGSASERTSAPRACVLVSHGGPIAAIMEALFPGTGRSRYDWQPRPGEGWYVRMEGRRPLGMERVTLVE